VLLDPEDFEAEKELIILMTSLGGNKNREFWLGF